MFDDYSAGLPLTVVVILENVSVAWIYGTKRYTWFVCLFLKFITLQKEVKLELTSV